MHVALMPLPVFHVPDVRFGEGLVAHAQGINSFAAVAAWDRDATAFASHVRAFLVHVPHIEAHISAVEQQAMRVHAGRGFFERLFSSPPMRAEIQAARQRLRGAASTLGSLVEQLEALVDQTPNTPEEKKAMLAELKMLKKELVQEKKQLNLAMREVRASARRANAHAVGAISSARYRRMQIRLDKEAALKPHEDEATAVERRILSVDRLILWIERIN